jgi:hypothetical protein
MVLSKPQSLCLYSLIVGYPNLAALQGAGSQFRAHAFCDEMRLTQARADTLPLPGR